MFVNDLILTDFNTEIDMLAFRKETWKYMFTNP